MRWSALALVALLPLAACKGGSDGGTVPDGETPTDGTDTVTSETGTPGDDDDDTTPTPTPTPTDTGTTDTGTTPGTGYAEPTRLEVTCTATANVLRYTCAVVVEPAQPVELSFVRSDGISMTRTVQSGDVVTDHELDLYFMAPNHDYDVTAWATAWPGDTATTTYTTGTLPPIVYSSLAVTGTPNVPMIGSHFPCSDDAIAVVYDTVTGEVVWYQMVVPGGQFGSLDMVQFTEDFTVLGESQGSVAEVDLMGNTLVSLPNLDNAFGVTAGGVFGNFHHDIYKRNGVYYVVYQETYGGGFFPDILDNLIVFDATGTELGRWVALDHLTLPSNWSGDFMHTNTIYVDAAGDIHLSLLTQETVVKFDGDWTSPSFGAPIWYLRGSNAGQIGSSFSVDWSGVPAPASWGDQHSLHERSDGRWELLDNRNGRALILSLDPVAGTATVDSAFDTRESSCGPQGTARSSASGTSQLVGCSGDTVREYDVATGSLLWSAELQCPGGGGPFGSSGSSRWYPLDGW